MWIDPNLYRRSASLFALPKAGVDLRRGDAAHLTMTSDGGVVLPSRQNDDPCGTVLADTPSGNPLYLAFTTCDGIVRALWVHATGMRV